jgi:Fe-S oxidoreductase
MTTAPTTAALRKQMDFCTWCPRLCHFACPSAHGDASEASTAWGLMSLAHHVGARELPLDASIARQFYHCASCGRCGAFCAHDHDVPSAMALARSEAHAAGLVPEEVVRLLDVLAPPEAQNPESHATNAPAQQARIGLFLGCTTRTHWGEDKVGRLASLVEALAGEPVRVIGEQASRCCGDVARRAGDGARAAALSAGLRHASLGLDVVLTDCAGALEQLEGSGVKGEAIVTWLAHHAAEIAPNDDASPAWVLHGGCQARRRIDLADDERALLAALGGSVQEAFAIQGEQECCGAEAIYAAVSPRGAERAARALLTGASSTPGLRLVTSRVACAAHLANAHGADDSVSGVVSVLDLVLERASW